MSRKQLSSSSSRPLLSLMAAELVHSTSRKWAAEAAGRLGGHQALLHYSNSKCSPPAARQSKLTPLQQVRVQTAAQVAR